jgi:fructose-specific PTS system IIA-like component
MESEINFTFPLPAGLHARPASQLAEIISSFSAKVSFANLRNGKQADGCSPLAMVTTDTRAGDPCRIRLAGKDAEEGKSRLENYLQGKFLAEEEAFENVPAQKSRPLSRSLLATGVKRFVRGRAACGGIGEGRIAWLKKTRPLPPLPPDSGKAGDFATGMKHLERSFHAVAQRYRNELSTMTGTAAAILKAQLSLLEDDALKTPMLALLNTGASAPEAISRGVDDFKRKLLASENDYLRARALDLEDICDQLMAEISGQAPAEGRLELGGPTILLAAHLTPKQFLSLDHRRLEGLALGEVGQTSHTVILARSFNVPTLIDVPVAELRGFDGYGVLDAQTGLLIHEDSPRLRKYYSTEKQKLACIGARQSVNLGKPARTVDGFPLEIGANIVSAGEAASSFRQGADGIGLFRTELLFADRVEAPDEEEQYLAYARVVQEARGRPVIIRTRDIGGDKPAPDRPLPRAHNPVLGSGGVRLYREHAGLIATQFHALWRASAHGPVKVMLPMVSCVEEARDSKAMLERVGGELRDKGFRIGASLSFGLMLEVPSVAFMLPELCEVADFFSVGTNDLTQYFLAVDRENKAVESLHSSLHPSFLRLLKKLVDEVHAHGRWIGLCGGMAENIPALPLLLGMGFDEISLPAAKIPVVKSAVAKLRRSDCGALLQRALASRTREEVESIVATGAAGKGPLLEAALVNFEVEATTKHEAIRALVNTLEIAGRTSAPDELEEALWLREESYSTGFGSGFALPHCKSNHVSDNSIVVLRLTHPVDWASLDGIPVDVIICLAIRESDHGREHMRNMACLARLMMSETFRNQIRGASSPDTLVELIITHLEPASVPASWAL